jgi:hypothetical protein
LTGIGFDFSEGSGQCGRIAAFEESGGLSRPRQKIDF